MNELLAKLTDLGYEFFGVLLPGVVTSVWILIWLVALGLPELSFERVWSFLGTLKINNLRAVIPTLMVWWFSGQVILAISRAGKADERAGKSALRRTLLSITFRVPRLPNNYNSALNPLFEVASRKISPIDGTPLNWRQFYPVAKAVLAREHSYSFVTNFQHKYTFHRSIVTAASIVFWLSILTMLFSVTCGRHMGLNPHWWLLTVLSLVGLAFVHIFSGTYLDNWLMFGDAIVTESAALLTEIPDGTATDK